MFILLLVVGATLFHVQAIGTNDLFMEHRMDVSVDDILGCCIDGRVL